MGPRIVLTGNTLATYPQGGGHWSVFLQYMLGLRELAHDFYWLELLRSQGDRKTDEHLIRMFLARLGRYDLQGHCVIALYNRDCPTPRVDDLEVFNLPNCDLPQFIDETDILWNFHCSMRDPLLSSFPRKALLDLDPGHLQVSALHWDMAIESHDVFFTVGQNINQPDCDVPALGQRWHTYLPPIYLPFWLTAARPQRDAPFTTITQWNWSEELWLGDRLLSVGKRDAYLRFLQLPNRCDIPLELAANIDPHDNTGDREMLVANGWRLATPHRLARTPEAYRRYIEHSRGEFGCAKPIHAALRTGWFSDRSAAFLASGRPVVIEDTGAANTLPVGRGILTFSSLQEACDRLHECVRNYDAHVDAARTIAADYLDSQKILPHLIELSFQTH